MQLAAVVALVVLASLVGLGVYTNNAQSRGSSALTWGPTQTATVVGVSERSVTVRESNGAILFIPNDCNYRVGQLAYYQVSSVDPAIDTQRVKPLC